MKIKKKVFLFLSVLLIITPIKDIYAGNFGDIRSKVILPKSTFNEKNVKINKDRLESLRKKLKDSQKNGTWNFSGSINNSSSDNVEELNTSTTMKYGLMFSKCIPDGNWQTYPKKVRDAIFPKNTPDSDVKNHFLNHMSDIKNNVILTRLNIFQPNSIIGLDGWVKEAESRSKGKGTEKFRLIEISPGVFGNSNKKMVEQKVRDVSVFFVKSVFDVVNKRSNSGRPVVSPDFLLGIATQEHGLGTNPRASILRNKNSWFSVGAVDHNPSLAVEYNLIEESINHAIDQIVKNYDYLKKGQFSSSMYGNTIIGVNEWYCSHSKNEPFSWSKGISKIINSVGKKYGDKEKMEKLNKIGCD